MLPIAGDGLQSVESVKVDVGVKCGACNYTSHHFYQIGSEPQPHSDDPDVRGLCGGCFASMLAGEGPFPDGGFGVVDMEDVGLEYPILNVEVHATEIPDSDLVRSDLCADLTQIMENALSSFPAGEFDAELGHVETHIADTGGEDA